MRYDTPVYFQTIKSEYDYSTGNYGISYLNEVMRYGSVTNSSEYVLNLVYGELKQGSLTVRLQNHFDEPFDRIRIGNKIYRVDSTRPLRFKQTFVISEVQ